MDAKHYREHVVRPQAVLYGRTQRYIDAFMSMVAQVGACNRLHDVEHRLARWLLMVHDRLGRDTFALTQEFLSMMLGVRRASVTVAAGILQHAGLIKLSRGTFFIPSHDLLAEAACGCYEVLRKDFAVLRRAELGLPPEGDIERRPLPRIANLSPAES
jgi:hypothetical protein